MIPDSVYLVLIIVLALGWGHSSNRRAQALLDLEKAFDETTALKRAIAWALLTRRHTANDEARLRHLLQTGRWDGPSLAELLKAARATFALTRDAASHQIVFRQEDGGQGAA